LKKRIPSEVSDNTLDARTEQEIVADTEEKKSKSNTSNDNSLQSNLILQTKL